MKTPDEWSVFMLKYMQDNPVKNLEEAKEQIKKLVGMVQKDALEPVTPTIQ